MRVIIHFTSRIVIRFGSETFVLFLLAAGLFGCSFGRKARRPADQNPSPMEEHTRLHARITKTDLPGVSFPIEHVLPKAVSVFVPDSAAHSPDYDLLVHFHGAAFVVNTAVCSQDRPMVAVSVQLGAGSSVYERPFTNEAVFPRLLGSVADSLKALGLFDHPASRIYLSAFSAGYGAIRAILRGGHEPVDGVLLLDGLHTDYIPDRVVLSQGGRLNEVELAPFLAFAREAVDGQKAFLITHSEIFPGTFASTTETTDYIIQKLGLHPEPVIEWGPGGMQLLSRTHKGRLTILGFAGITAPDHVDHLHGLPEFLRMLVQS